MQIIKTIIWIAVVMAFVRGLFVWDMGPSAQNSYPIASAVCLIGSILSSILMLHLQNKNGN